MIYLESNLSVCLGFKFSDEDRVLVQLRLNLSYI